MSESIRISGERTCRSGLHIVLLLAIVLMSSTVGLGQSARERQAKLDEAAQKSRQVQELAASGRLREALPPAQQAVALLRQTLGDEHSDYGAALGDLGSLYHALGQWAEAEAPLARAVEISRKNDASGLGHATALGNLAGLYCSMGDYARAAPLARRAMQITQSVRSRSHPDTATSLNNLGGIHYAQGEYTKALPLFREALEIRQKTLGPTAPEVAASLNNLAGVHQSLDQFAQAEPLYQQALELSRQEGPISLRTADALNNLASLHRAMGRYGEALPRFEQSLDIRRSVLGPRHPLVAASLNNLAALYRSKGEPNRAAECYRQALESFEAILDNTLGVLSERQQLALCRSLRQTLDGYLSVVAQSSQPDAWEYRYVLRWKGAVFVHQRQSRLAALQPEFAPLLAALQETSSQLASLAMAVPDTRQQDAWRRELLEAVRRKERLEATLARQSEPFRASRRQATPEQLQAALPANVTLVDFLEYAHSPVGTAGAKEPAAAGHLMAFVVRPQGAIVRVSLGPCRGIHEAIGLWRKSFGRTREAAHAASELRRLVWLPLEPHLGKVLTVVVSPDGLLARFPLAALPGSTPESYLIEERAVAVIPVPQALPTLLESRSDPTIKQAASLLLVGDVDYDASPAAASERSSRPDGQIRFPALENTRGEMLAVRDSFERAYPDSQVRMLRGSGASRTAFCAAAPKFRYLHVATHGFFATSKEAGAPGPTLSATTASELSAFYPGLLSGLALAGANRSESGRQDGILTAEQVASLPLEQVEVAVLSACETGLGSLAAGEGALGLQRAFQLSGARTVAATLWPISDRSTRTLVERFYQNLWVQRLGKLEALREAQLWMLHHDDDRGLAIVPADPNSRPPHRSPPFIWAPFVLSGDWR